MSEWMEGEFGCIAEIIMGQSPKGETCNTNRSGLPLLNGPTEYGMKYPEPLQYTVDPKRLAEKGDILFCVRGSTTGRMNWADQRYAIGRGLAAIRPKKDQNITPFIKGLIDFYLPTLLSGADGSVFPNITGIQLSKMRIAIPPLPEQRAIAGVLSSLDYKIDLLNRQNKTLEGIAEALWRKMFIEEVKPEWEIVPLGKLAELQRGISYHGNQLAEAGNGTPMHNLNSIDISGSYKYEGIKFYKGKIKGTQKLKASDLLIVNTDITQNNRIIGWPIFVPESFVESTFTHHLYSVTLKSDKISKLYLFFLLRHRDYRETLASSANGTTVSMLSKEAIYNLEISIPPVDKRQRFEEIASYILNKQSLNNMQIKTINELRDKLLPKLMSGEVRVKLN